MNGAKAEGATNITPQVPAGRNIVRTYGDGGFVVAENRHTGSLLVFADRVVPWAVARIEDVTADSFDQLLARKSEIEILLVGCGARFPPVPPDIHNTLRQAGIAADFMDTGAACRTFNVLLAEDRRVAAALIAVD